MTKTPAHEVPLSNEELKMAILKANIEHGDVALRALARIDSDDRFRKALQVIVDTGDADRDKQIHSFVYTQFKPGTFHYLRNNDDLEKVLLENIKSVKNVKIEDVMRALNVRALSVAIKHLSDKSIDKTITDLVQSTIRKMMFALLGFRDTFGIEIEHHRSSPIRDKIEKKIASKIDAALEKLLDNPDIDTLVARKKGQAVAVIKKTYEYEFDDALQGAARKWAKERARTDAEKYMASVGGVLADEDEDEDCVP